MSRLSDAKKAYPSVDFDKWNYADPSKNGKYLSWIGKNINDSISELSSVEEVNSLLRLFEKRIKTLKEKDINKYTLDSLNIALSDLKLSRKEGKIKGCKDLGMVGSYKVILLEGEDAVKAYTAKTNWCISNFETFLSYSFKCNMFVLIKGKNKLCVKSELYRNNIYSSFYFEDDTHKDLSDLESLGNFVDLSEIKTAIKFCDDYSKINKNKWFDVPNLPISKKIDIYIEHFGNRCILDKLKLTNQKQLLQLFNHIIKDQVKYKDLIYYISRDKNHQFDLNFTHQLWENFIKPKPKKLSITEIKNKIMDKTIMDKLMKDKDFMQIMRAKVEAL